MSPAKGLQNGNLCALGSATLRLRSDIEWIVYPDTGRWVALDPITNAYYYFSALEYQTARLLDGERSVSQVYDFIQRTACPNAQLNSSWMEIFVQKLFRSQLLESPSGFETSKLAVGAKKGSVFSSLLTNPLSVRIPLFRPSIDYRWAHWFARAAFSPYLIVFLFLGLLFVSYLVALKIVSRPDELLYDVSKIQGDRWLVLAAVLVATKSLHELGHYLACVYLKVRCSEIGALFLCFTPCLYCDTTESWKLPSRWHRAGIAAAGIYFEFWIALLGGLIFLNSQSGLMHLLAGGLWFMCTLGTIVLNANPFFRYDGYFILSDLIGVPNLAAQSSSALWDSLVAGLGGKKIAPGAYDLSTGWLAAFALVSMAYRWLVMGSIVFFLWHLLIPTGLGLYFLAISAAMAVGIARTSIGHARTLAGELFAPEPISPWRLSALVGLIAAGLLAVFFVPLPNRVVHRGYIEYSESKPIYAPEDGLVKKIGSWAQEPMSPSLQTGELIALLDHPELQLERNQQEHLYLQISGRVEIYKQAAISDESLASEIPTLEEMKAEAASKLKLLDERIEKLSILAPNDGRFLPRTGWNPAGFGQGQVKRIWQPVLSSTDLSRRFKRGELMGWFVGQMRTEAIALVSAETIRSIDHRTAVDVVCDTSPGDVFKGHITYLSSDPVPFFPSELAGDSMFVLQRDERGMLQSDIPLYKVRIEWEQDPRPASRGGLCSARFDLPKSTIAQRIYRFIASQFKAS